MEPIRLGGGHFDIRWHHALMAGPRAASWVGFEHAPSISKLALFVKNPF